MGKLVALLFLVLLAVLCIDCATSYNVGVYTYTHKHIIEESPKRIIPIWIDKNFGNADRVYIDDAINQWNYVLNGNIVLGVVDFEFDDEENKVDDQEKQNGWLILKINSKSNLVSPSEKGYWNIAFVNKIGGNYLYIIRDRLNDTQVFGTTMHEIGHLLGATHNSGGLMFKYYNRGRFQCADFDAVKEVADYQHIEMENLNYCINGKS
jgi:hypothetical protein